ncbi:hypothetical protein P8907_19890 [Bacillus atrophaeus]|uniref:hypothetical protein n=1 Tax=Bacillus atrophaeus TaxID=1452 RepID=UPI00228295F1|nr:hypothetical protein [Bacillus atrophaeus]MCY8911055.1 hypothetical protein [Bacillus atrophaeus]MEC0836362.1 hypothetical protein [Bacillus atrophaeus]MEC0846588.1 hypothetical protein [Bacillus atrophaeus]MEC0850886.1 hypothetical protein [Bacillus atrophaeus]MEC0867632.1 hypothetical protein [Bacillus atrophaeus]
MLEVLKGMEENILEAMRIKAEINPLDSLGIVEGEREFDIHFDIRLSGSLRTKKKFQNAEEAQWFYGELLHELNILRPYLSMLLENGDILTASVDEWKTENIKAFETWE